MDPGWPAHGGVSGVRFGLLGPLEVCDETGAAVPVTGPRLRVLLAALLLRANMPISREALAEAVWDGAPPPAAQDTLRSHVRRLRRVLSHDGEGRIAAHGAAYLIHLSDSELDISRFETLCRRTCAALHMCAWAEASDAAEHALGLWRAAPLADIPSQELCDEFVPRLERLRLQALEDWAEADLHLGRHDHLVPRLRDLATTHPLRERFHAQLMVALARCGRRAEALEVYRDARRVLVDQLGIEPGQELRALHERILAGDIEPPAALVADIPPKPARPADAVPRQLPSTPGYLTGRQTELGTLINVLEGSAAGGAAAAGATVAIWTIDGMAGVGKTALAVDAGHRLAERFPDGQLFIDLHGYARDQPPRPVEAALQSLLRTLGVPTEQIPADTEERAALYRQCLAGTRTLIVLDNALSEAQVRPLLPGSAGCLVLITSRRRLKGLHDAHPLALDVLPEADAVALLRAIAGPGRIAAGDPLPAEIAELCGRLPLALRIAGVLLRHRPAWGLEHVAGPLRDQRTRIRTLSDGERDLGTVFDLSYAGLDERHRLLFRRLGLLPGPETDAYAAAALLETDPTTATGLLEDLVDHNLLIEHAPGRYRLNDLLRAHACTLADQDSPEDLRAALDRLLGYYATVQTAALLMAPRPRSAPTSPPSPPGTPTPGGTITNLRGLRTNDARVHNRTAATIAVAVAVAVAE